MKKIIFLVLFLPQFLCAQSFENVILEFKKGNYQQSAQILEKFEKKDSRIYYYLGLSYYKSWNTPLAKTYFLLAHMNNPDSPWGKAAYKNFVFLTQRKFSFLLSGAVKFDSNLSYLPELEPDKLSDSFLDLYFRMKLN